MSESLTLESVLAFIEHHACASSYHPERDPLTFVDQNAVDQYNQALEWWPDKEFVTDLPDYLAPPTLYLMCNSFNDLNYAFGNSFALRLNHYAQTLCTWLTENGYSTQTPNETKDERKARKNREAQTRFRASNKPAVDFALQARIDVEVEALAELTRQRDAALADLDQQVTTAQAAFLQLCATRTAERNRWQGLVGAQRELVSKTKRGAV